jgi:hypothetical protein
MILQKYVIGTCVASLIMFTAPVQAEDLRQAVTLPENIKANFLAEMRGHMGNLDDILTALSENDFKEAADIADIKMDFGHMMWQGMSEQGMSPEQIMAMKKKMKGMGRMHGQGAGQGQGAGAGMGRFMPEDFRAMGQGFHQAASEFAIKARAAGSKPSAQDFGIVLGALEEVTAVCRGCHDAFRIQ